MLTPGIFIIAECIDLDLETLRLDLRPCVCERDNGRVVCQRFWLRFWLFCFGDTTGVALDSSLELVEGPDSFLEM